MAKPKEAVAAQGRLIEGFMKGPIAISAKVIRGRGQPEAMSLPLFQVPVLKFEDQLDLSFSGEAFDPRVTSADWSLVVVFLPKTVAPTDQGVVSFRLQHKGDRMVVPAIPVPYDSIPMLFLIPDKTGRKKVLKDLNAHLESFRALCAKIANLSAERATVDKFVEDLEAIDKTMSPVQYDNALETFLHTYGSAVSVDVQAFSAANHSNLDKCQFLTQEFQKTNVLVPDPAGATPGTVQAGVTVGGGHQVSAYVSIFFDVATIISNLWPGHQFQYLPALARNFHDCDAELYYTDWIHTTGDTLGALMCCPGKWEEQLAPEFDLELPWGESLLRKQVLLKIQPKEKGRSPFSLYGHDWKLLVSGPKGESLPPLVLTASPNKDAFVATPAPLLDPLRKLGAMKVKARIVGRWGFTSIATAPLEMPVGFDPAWSPSAEEKADFQVGKACAFLLPPAWAGIVDKVVFLPAAAGVKPIPAKLTAKDGSFQAAFTPKEESAGEGTLAIHLFGNDRPGLTRPMRLRGVAPEPQGVEARLGETSVRLLGHHLKGVKALEIGQRQFLPSGPDAADPGGMGFKAADGKAFEDGLGAKLSAAMVTGEGRTALDPVRLLPARPRLREVLVNAIAANGSSITVTSTWPIAPTSAASQVSLVAAKGYRFPFDGAFHAALRNPEEPAELRLVPAAKIRVMGNNQKATFTFIPTDLLGGRASGKLEVQVQDDHAGTSDWLPLPATFLDLPVISAYQEAPPGGRLTGPSLDAIEAVAPAPEGPWEQPAVQVEEGHEIMTLTTPLVGNTCYLKVFGWPDLVLAMHLPVVPAPVKLPAPPPLATPLPPRNPEPR